MAEDDPLLVASASSALTHWRAPTKGSNERIPNVFVAARSNVETFVDHSDELTSALAQATIAIQSYDAARMYRPRTPRREVHGQVSLMIHGTFAWDKDWWLPGGEFHEYIKTGVRPNLYSSGDAFGWSGRYRAADRKVAADRLAWWLEAKGKPAVQTVFAHSYGGAVALMATMQDVKMDTAVLLSVPVANYEVEWRNIRRAVSLRIHCDLVLLAARAKQRFTSNVEEHWIDSWFVHHASSHHRTTWEDGHWADLLGLY